MTDTDAGPLTRPIVDWMISDAHVPYLEAVDWMEARAEAIFSGEASETIWLLEHPPLYTAGTSAKTADLLMPDRFPVHTTGRGGEYTYHGPGQRVAYVMLDLRRRGRDVRKFVDQLETWIIRTLSQFNIDGDTHPDRVGVWVDRTRSGGPQTEDKIAAIGIRLRRWISFHGIALNVDPDLDHFDGITPCGIADPSLGVTSLHDLGHLVTLSEVDTVLRAAFEDVFESTTALKPAPAWLERVGNT
ncbi:MAG: lipoyl(octanoyl) transferase LipB [Pseudomonadota bacterium]